MAEKGRREVESVEELGGGEGFLYLSHSFSFLLVVEGGVEGGVSKLEKTEIDRCNVVIGRYVRGGALLDFVVA